MQNKKTISLFLLLFSIFSAFFLPVRGEKIGWKAMVKKNLKDNLGQVLINKIVRGKKTHYTKEEMAILKQIKANQVRFSIEILPLLRARDQYGNPLVFMEESNKAWQNMLLKKVKKSGHTAYFKELLAILNDSSFAQKRKEAIIKEAHYEITSNGGAQKHYRGILYYLIWFTRNIPVNKKEDPFKAFFTLINDFSKESLWAILTKKNMGLNALMRAVAHGNLVATEHILNFLKKKFTKKEQEKFFFQLYEDVSVFDWIHNNTRPISFKILRQLLRYQAFDTEAKKNILAKGFLEGIGYEHCFVTEYLDFLREKKDKELTKHLLLALDDQEQSNPLMLTIKRDEIKGNKNYEKNFRAIAYFLQEVENPSVIEKVLSMQNSKKESVLSMLAASKNPTLIAPIARLLGLQKNRAMAKKLFACKSAQERRLFGIEATIFQKSGNKKAKKGYTQQIKSFATEHKWGVFFALTTFLWISYKFFEKNPKKEPNSL